MINTDVSAIEERNNYNSNIPNLDLHLLQSSS